MASNTFRAIVAYDNLERNPGSTEPQTTTLQLQVGISVNKDGPAGSAMGQASTSTSITTQSTDQVLRETGQANDLLQNDCYKSLANIVTPTVSNPQGAPLGQTPAVGGFLMQRRYFRNAREKLLIV